MERRTMIQLGAFVVAVGAGALVLGQRRSSESEARRWVREGARLVDVRSPAEFAAGHITGAVNVPVDRLESQLDTVGARDGAVVVYCASGRRSRWATEKLRAAGYTRVLDLGPMSAW
jgi:phage shock protein E